MKLAGGTGDLGFKPVSGDLSGVDWRGIFLTGALLLDDTDTGASFLAETPGLEVEGGFTFAFAF
jgi:hypothetical protein